MTASPPLQSICLKKGIIPVLVSWMAEEELFGDTPGRETVHHKLPKRKAIFSGARASTPRTVTAVLGSKEVQRGTTWGRLPRQAQHPHKRSPANAPLWRTNCIPSSTPLTFLNFIKSMLNKRTWLVFQLARNIPSVTYLPARFSERYQMKTDF